MDLRTHVHNENMDTPSLRRFRGSVRDTVNGRVITAKNYFSRSKEFFELLLTRVHGVLRVDDGESSLALDDHVRPEFPRSTEPPRVYRVNKG